MHYLSPRFKRCVSEVIITIIGAFPFRHEPSCVLIVRRKQLVIVHATSDLLFDTHCPVSIDTIFIYL